MDRELSFGPELTGIDLNDVMLHTLDDICAGIDLNDVMSHTLDDICACPMSHHIKVSRMSRH
jgi:hypothetical protein